MDLKTFVAETLTQIVEGVEDARKRVAELDTNAAVNPGIVGAHARREIGSPTPVEFDVAVTVVDQSEDKTGSKGSASVGFLSVVSAKLAGEVEEATVGTTRNESISRVKFSVNLSQPADILRSEPKQQPRARPAVNSWTAR